MSGVGAPAVRPRNHAPGGDDPTSHPHMSGVGAPAVRPRPVARARKRPHYVREPLVGELYGPGPKNGHTP
eukprot:gene20816-biopygen4110